MSRLYDVWVSFRDYEGVEHSGWYSNGKLTDLRHQASRLEAHMIEQVVDAVLARPGPGSDESILLGIKMEPAYRGSTQEYRDILRSQDWDKTKELELALKYIGWCGHWDDYVTFVRQQAADAEYAQLQSNVSSQGSSPKNEEEDVE